MTPGSVLISHEALISSRAPFISMVIQTKKAPNKNGVVNLYKYIISADGGDQLATQEADGTLTVDVQFQFPSLKYTASYLGLYLWKGEFLWPVFVRIKRDKLLAVTVQNVQLPVGAELQCSVVIDEEGVLQNEVTLRAVIVGSQVEFGAWGKVFASPPFKIHIRFNEVTTETSGEL
jgi:hypothetical protein